MIPFSKEKEEVPNQRKNKKNLEAS